MCLQSYPIGPGERIGSEQPRLWLMRSKDLVYRSEPVPLKPEGCRTNWAISHRQIDPYIINFEGKYWCFYKTEGQIGLLFSDDLVRWQESHMDRPLHGADQTADQATIENPCVVRTDDRFALFFAKVGKGRSIGLAYSDNLRSWRNAHYVDFPALDWAPIGPIAPAVIDLRGECGVWLMAFHGEWEVTTELDFFGVRR